MTVEQTSARVVEFLSQPASYPDAIGHVELIETHISWVFLAGRYVYKLKKPVRFDFLDFSTVQARHRACLDELRLNRRLAPHVYLDVIPVRQDAQGRLLFGGEGVIVDWVVKMRRLPADRTLASVIRHAWLPASEIEELAAKLSDFHRRAVPVEVRPSEHRLAIEQHVRANLDELRDPAHHLERVVVQRVGAAQMQCLNLLPQLFDDRVQSGHVVEGHGDLRPEHIYLDADINIIDCVEFSLDLRTVDVADELCFAAMECERIGGANVGKHLLRSYCDACGDRPDPRLISFYKSYRACVRAKVNTLRLQQVGPAARQAIRSTIQSYLHLADLHATAVGRPLAIVVRGLMGTGKSTLAKALSDAIGAELLQTDALRADILGASARELRYGEGRYGQRNRDLVYQEMFRRARRSMANRLSVVFDATFLTTDSRAIAVGLAEEFGAAHLVVECKCPVQVAQRRISERLATGASTSEARPELFEAQRQQQEPNPAGIACLAVDSTDRTEVQVENVLRRLSHEWLNAGVFPPTRVTQQP